MRVFALKSCETCRKAIKALTQAGLTFEVIDVRADGVAEGELVAILDQFGEEALNKASTTWRGLDEAARADDPLALLTAHQTLIKRPVITDGNRWTLGWKADAQSVWLGE
ncbi:arsenate reductase family protein [Cognatiyoonia sp.]|uniref:arsenate reductase family protein n=1 Tax=Cognatiyoonia sp. TaxID=2211652 RepID=UPI003F69B4D5